MIMVFKDTCNNISVISWRSVLLEEETEENRLKIIVLCVLQLTVSDYSFAIFNFYIDHLFLKFSNTTLTSRFLSCHI
jgi:hypothetical protein